MQPGPCVARPFPKWLFAGSCRGGRGHGPRLGSGTGLTGGQLDWRGPADSAKPVIAAMRAAWSSARAEAVATTTRAFWAWTADIPAMGPEVAQTEPPVSPGKLLSPATSVVPPISTTSAVNPATGADRMAGAARLSPG